MFLPNILSVWCRGGTFSNFLSFGTICSFYLASFRFLRNSGTVGEIILIFNFGLIFYTLTFSSFLLCRSSGRKCVGSQIYFWFYITLCFSLWFLVSRFLYLFLDDSSRMDRQRREEELKGRSSKKAHEAEQSILNRVCIVSKVLLYFLFYLLLRVTQITWSFNICC